MSHRCCLIHIVIIIPKHTLYLVYLSIFRIFRKLRNILNLFHIFGIFQSSASGWILANFSLTLLIKVLLTKKIVIRFKRMVLEVSIDADKTKYSPFQFVIFKPLSYCFEETIGFDVRPRLQVVQCRV